MYQDGILYMFIKFHPFYFFQVIHHKLELFFFFLKKIIITFRPFFTSHFNIGIVTFKTDSLRRCFKESKNFSLN